MVRFHLKAPNGQIPERPNGSDCKSDVSDFGGSNPPLSTRKKTPVRCLFLVVQVVRNPPYSRWFARGAKNGIVRINSAVFERRHFGFANHLCPPKKGYLYGYPFLLYLSVFLFVKVRNRFGSEFFYSIVGRERINVKPCSFCS